MKKCITGLALLSAFSAFGNDPVTCLDSGSFSGEENFMIIQDGRNFELSALRIGGVDYLDVESNGVECQAGSEDAPMGGVEGEREITCNLPNALWASIHYSIDGKGSASVFSRYNDLQVDEYSEFECSVFRPL